MKFKLESAFIASVLGIFLVLSLVACSETDTSLPHVFGGSEVPPEVLAEPRLVETPSQADLDSKAWPRLGDVPAMPKTFSPHPVIDQAMTEMENDRSQAKEAEQSYENPPVTAPVLYH